MAIGVGILDDLVQCNFQGTFPKSVAMVTSQGYIIQGGETRKSSLIFGTGDILYCKYDPFYGMLDISKDNGRAVCLRLENTREWYGCVRLTYASD